MWTVLQGKETRSFTPKSKGSIRWVLLGPCVCRDLEVCKRLEKELWVGELVFKPRCSNSMKAWTLKNTLLQNTFCCRLLIHINKSWREARVQMPSEKSVIITSQKHLHPTGTETKGSGSMLACQDEIEIRTQPSIQDMNWPTEEKTYTPHFTTPLAESKF